VRLAPAALCFLLSFPGAARADEEDDLFKDSSSTKTSTEEVDVKSFRDDEEIDIPIAPPPVKAPPPEPVAAAPAGGRMPLDTAGKTVLADNWAPTVVIVDADAVVVELPVLYGRDRKSFDGTAYWLVAEAWADGRKVAESRAWVAAEAIADKGPSVQFFRLLAPVGAPSGLIEVRVGKAGTATAKPTPLFTRSVPYKV
jgi:hypothetical protein